MANIRNWTLPNGSRVWLDDEAEYTFTSTAAADQLCFSNRAWFRVDLRSRQAMLMVHWGGPFRVPLNEIDSLDDFIRWGRMTLAMVEADHD